MASLTEVSAVARKSIKGLAIFLVILMIIPVVYRTVLKWWRDAHPAPPPMPTVRYGKLPMLNFPKITEGTQPEYKLETITGSLPAGLADSGRVYVVGINRSRLVSLDRIRGMAKTLGFTTDLVRESEQRYKFTHQNLPAELRFNIITWEFAYKFDWTSDPTVYDVKSRNPQANNAIQEARGYFQSIGLLSSDLATGTGKYQYFIATNSAMVQTDSYFESYFTKVDLFRANKDNMKVLAPGGDVGSPVNIILSGTGGNKRVLQANYYYSMTVDNDFATYPLKGVVAAYDELVKGGGYIAKKAGEKVTIRKASLAYYESAEPQAFLQPIYVFEGDGNFMGFVQAVRTDYLNVVATPTETPQATEETIIVSTPTQ